MSSGGLGLEEVKICSNQATCLQNKWGWGWGARVTVSTCEIYENGPMVCSL